MIRPRSAPVRGRSKLGRHETPVCIMQPARLANAINLKAAVMMNHETHERHENKG